MESLQHICINESFFPIQGSGKRQALFGNKLTIIQSSPPLNG